MSFISTVKPMQKAQCTHASTLCSFEGSLISKYSGSITLHLYIYFFWNAMGHFCSSVLWECWCSFSKIIFKTQHFSKKHRPWKFTESLFQGRKKYLRHLQELSTQTHKMSKTKTIHHYLTSSSKLDITRVEEGEEKHRYRKSRSCFFHSCGLYNIR